ncbi:MAG: restriction endonuclease subunit M [Desulfuromonadaceae bacterium GWB2_53_15]|nr:MAG: restriction endonuclease subunit M [Desulfuromonadales bacterium GWD2_54_10]OHB30792.1 MAG: restriction endonuclease subunit M [Desulfuromonadaceae bacterium GWB2_53_15]
MTQTLDIVEKERLALQIELDSRKMQVERNRLGQFATPTALARDILGYAATLLAPEEQVHFLDPAIGTGAFYSALLNTFPQQRIAKALGFEIDPHYGQPASLIWQDFDLTLKLADFTYEEPSPRFNLVICNPPYVRHHHIQASDKERLLHRSFKASNMKLSGLTGLYCHFLALSHAWMAEGGIAGWLIPSEFMDVNYGQVVKQYLLSRVTLLHIHRFDPNDVQFADALVSSSIVWFRNAPPPPDHDVMFSFGGTLAAPKITRMVPVKALAHEAKWTRFPASEIRSRKTGPSIADFFQIKRGIATGDNGFFILGEETISKRGLPLELFRPILPSPRYLPEDEVTADKDGIPLVERRLFLLDTRLSEEEIGSRFPALATYLEEGKAKGVHEGYICDHRSPWYVQENRPPAPIVCTYLGRGETKSGRPFRFILNNSRATIANVYLAMYPTLMLQRYLARDPGLTRLVWQVLNAITPEQLLDEGRVYGGGLHKLEPKELANVDASAIAELLPRFERGVELTQLDMFGVGELAA